MSLQFEVGPFLIQKHVNIKEYVMTSSCNKKNSDMGSLQNEKFILALHEVSYSLAP